MSAVSASRKRSPSEANIDLRAPTRAQAQRTHLKPTMISGFARSLRSPALGNARVAAPAAGWASARVRHWTFGALRGESNSSPANPCSISETAACSERATCESSFPRSECSLDLVRLQLTSPTGTEPERVQAARARSGHSRGSGLLFPQHGSRRRRRGDRHGRSCWRGRSRRGNGRLDRGADEVHSGRSDRRNDQGRDHLRSRRRDDQRRSRPRRDRVHGRHRTTRRRWS